MPSDSDRVSRVRATMGAVALMVAGPGFEKIQPARWRHLGSDLELETGYTNGEGRVRLYEPDDRKPAVSFIFTGSDGELSTFMLTFPQARVYLGNLNNRPIL